MMGLFPGLTGKYLTCINQDSSDIQICIEQSTHPLTEQPFSESNSLFMLESCFQSLEVTNHSEELQLHIQAILRTM